MLVRFFQVHSHKGSTVKQQFDIISKICEKYLGKQINLYEYYENINYDNINEILTQTLEKISEKYSYEVQPVNYMLEMFAEKFGIELQSTDPRAIIQEITQNEEYIRNHKNFGKPI